MNRSVISFDFTLPRYAQDERKGDRRNPTGVCIAPYPGI